MLSEAQKNKLIQDLTAAGATRPCPRCGHPRFTLTDGYALVPIQDNLHYSVPGAPFIPCVTVICDRCGFVAHHALTVLESPNARPGWDPEEQGWNPPGQGWSPR